MGHYDSLKEHLAEIEKSLEADMSPFALQVEQLSSIYGISTTASCAVIAGIGIDMKPFKTAFPVCTGNREAWLPCRSTSLILCITNISLTAAVFMDALL